METFKTSVLNLQRLGMVALTAILLTSMAGKPAHASSTTLAVTFVDTTRVLRFNLTVNLEDSTSKWKNTTLNATGPNYLTWSFSEWDEGTTSYPSGIGDHDDVALLPGPDDTLTLEDGTYDCLATVWGTTGADGGTAWYDGSALISAYVYHPH